MVRKNIATASEEYRKAVEICRNVFAAAGRDFNEPQGVRDLMTKARALFAEDSDEVGAAKEVDHARQWLIAIAGKFLRGGIEFFEGRIAELSYMSLDRDIMENMQARMRDYCAAVTIGEGDDFEERIETYRQLHASVFGARAEQQRRVENRERRAQEEAQKEELERKLRRRQQEEQSAEAARKKQEAASAAAREKRGKQFDELFS